MEEKKKIQLSQKAKKALMNIGLDDFLILTGSENGLSKRGREIIIELDKEFKKKRASKAKRA